MSLVEIGDAEAKIDRKLMRTTLSGGGMKVMHIAPHCREIGNGVVNVAVDLACKQAETGNEVSFVSAGGSYQTLLERHGVRHFHMNEPSLRRAAATARAIFDLRKAIQTTRPEVINAHTVPAALMCACLKWKSSYRLVTTIHNEPQRQAVLMGVGDRVIAVSTAVAESMIRRGISKQKIRVVRNGTLGSPRRSGLAVLPAQLQRPAIVTVARLFEQKGIGELIEAFGMIARRYPEAHLYLVGDGPEREAFEKRSAEQGCSARVHFIGFVSDPRAYLSAADIFVLASRKDPFPLVILEAREAGCAIVASNVDGIPEALEHGEAGILVPPADPMQLSEAISGLLENPARLAFFQARSRENLEWLRLDRVAEDTLAVYKDALEGNA